MTEHRQFTEEEKQLAHELVEKLFDVIEHEPPAVCVAAFGTLLCYTIVNAMGEHNGALDVVQDFTEKLVNSVDDAFLK